MVNSKTFICFVILCSVLTGFAQLRPSGYSNLKIPAGRKRPLTSTTTTLSPVPLLPQSQNISRIDTRMGIDKTPYNRRMNYNIATPTLQPEVDTALLPRNSPKSAMVEETPMKDNIPVETYAPTLKVFQSMGNVVSTEEAQSLEFDDTQSEPIAVDVAMQIQSIWDINENDQKVIIEIDLTVHWKDYEYMPEDESYVPPEEMENVTDLLKQFGGEPLSTAEFDELWKPDIFIERVVEVTKPTLLSSPVTVRTIRNASSIVYNTRANIKLDCHMNFRFYPADTQHCVLDLRSYQSDETKMNLRWNPLPGAYLVDITTDDNFDLKLTHATKRKKLIKDIDLGDAVFDVLQIKLSMRRRLTYHLLQTYVPSAFLVFITWLSFLIPEELIEARIGITMTTLLALTAMFAGVRENTPVVSYVRAIDIWMAYCIFSVFATLLEFAFFIRLRNFLVSKQQKKVENVNCDNSTKTTQNKDDSQNHLLCNLGQREHCADIPEAASSVAAAFAYKAKILDQSACAFFVGNFLIFCIIYWPWIVISSEHNSWQVNSTLNGDPEDVNEGFLA